MFCDVSKSVVNSKILIVSGMPIRLIFQNLVTNDTIAVEFSSYIGVISTMDVEKFHIYLTPNANPFCITSPRSVLHQIMTS